MTNKIFDHFKQITTIKTTAGTYKFTQTYGGTFYKNINKCYKIVEMLLSKTDSIISMESEVK